MSPASGPVRHACALALAVAPLPALSSVPDYAPPQLQARSNLIANDNGWNLPPGSSFNSITASINDSGEVAFPVQIVPIDGDLSNTAPGVWFGANGSGGIVALVDNEGIADRVAINALGELAWYSFGSSYVLHRYDAVNGASMVSTTPYFPNAIGGVSLNDSGEIGWRGSFAGGRAFISTAGSGSVLHVAETGLDPGSPYAFLYTPSMNAGRIMAGKVNVGSTTPVEIRRFAANGSSERVVADVLLDPGSPFDRFDNSLALTDSGSVAVVVRLASGAVRAIYRFDPDAGGTIATEIARVEPAGTIREIDSFAPAINDDGLVVFRARDAIGQAIYAGDGSALVRVVGLGSAVDTDLGPGRIGQHDSSPIFSGAPTLNAHGDIAFIAALHPDGNNTIEWGSGVFVARAGGTDGIFSDGFDG